MAALTGSHLFEKVMSHTDADLGAALSALRDHPASIAVAVPGPDEIQTTLMEGTNIPLFSEIRSAFTLIISGRQLDKRETGDPKTLALKDAVLSLLLCADLGIPDLVTLPSSCEPMAIEFENGKGREAWKLELELRQILTN